MTPHAEPRVQRHYVAHRPQPQESAFSEVRVLLVVAALWLGVVGFASSVPEHRAFDPWPFVGRVGPEGVR